jgi:hypothetical protein
LSDRAPAAEYGTHRAPRHCAACAAYTRGLDHSTLGVICEICWNPLKDRHAGREGKKRKGPAQTPATVARNARQISKAKRARIYERDGYRCVKCGREKPLSIDHIVPLVRGGSRDDSNLQTLCVPCNVAKGAR